MAVGGIGMCCTANYAAREFGVRSAMPGFIARRLCPGAARAPCPARPARATCPGGQAPPRGALTSSARFAELVFVKPCFEKYSRASNAARVIFAAFDPDYEACSLDEACLDITDYCAAHGVSGAHRCDVADCAGHRHSGC
jgi:DNA polymerase kappa